MAYNPGVGFFITFYELNPSRQRRCIYFTQKGTRCLWPCQENDNRRAIALREEINATQSEADTLALLLEYVLCNCCRSGRAQHRDRIEDVGLLIPLALRWQEEIRRRVGGGASVPTFPETRSTPPAYSIPTTPSSTHTTTLNTPTTTPSYCRIDGPKAFSPGLTFLDPVASLSPYQHSSPSHQYSASYQYGSPPYQYGSPNQYDSSAHHYGSSYLSNDHKATYERYGSPPRYDLRPREVSSFTDSTLSLLPPDFQLPLSEFRPHVANPGPNDSVAQKILSDLEDRDFETGSLYIFDRDSSPGHVKIGWTARSVSLRLEDWSKCGYTPNLIFRVDNVPHAQRVETLVHHDLIKLWRRERKCKAPWCQKSHQEWFEISKERATKVLSDWAYFMTRAEPYDTKGRLTDRWRVLVKKMDMNEEVVNVERLLRQYEESLIEGATLVEVAVDFEQAVKVEEKEVFQYVQMVQQWESVETAPIPDSSQTEVETLPTEILLPEIDTLSQGILLIEPSLPEQEGEAKRQSLLETQSSPRINAQLRSQLPCHGAPETEETIFKSEPVAERDFLLITGPPLQIETASKIGTLVGTESLPESTLLLESEALHDIVPTSQMTPVGKDLLPEEIPLPPSPLLQPAISMSSPERTKPEEIPLPPSPLLQPTVSALSLEETRPEEISLPPCPFLPPTVSALSSEETRPEEIPLPPSPLLQPTFSILSPEETRPEEIPLSASPFLPPVRSLLFTTETASYIGASTEESSVIDTIAGYDTNTIVVDNSAKPSINSSGVTPVPASDSATLGREVPPQIEAHDNTGINNNSYRPSPSDTSIPSNPLDLSVAAVSADENFGHNAQTDHAELDLQKPDEKHVDGEKRSEAGTDGWDADATLVEEETSGSSLEEQAAAAASKVVDEISTHIPTGNVNGLVAGMSGSDCLLQSEAPPSAAVAVALA